MKLKGINPFEQHAEKIVLGVVGTAMLGALGYQFLRSSDIKVGGKDVPLSAAFVPTETEARRVQGAIDNPSPTLPPEPKFDLGEKMSLGRDAKVGPTTLVAAMGRPVDVKGFNPERAVATSQYSLPAVAAPKNVSTNAFRSTVSPMEVIRHAELAKFVPAVQPFDKAAVSVEAEFSGTLLRDALAADPDGSGPLEAMPGSWWRDVGGIGDLVDVLAVQIERETIATPEGRTPEKAEVVVLPPLPGRVNAIAEWENSVKGPGDVPFKITELRPLSDDIQRAPYYQTIAGPEWLPPSEASKADDENPNGREIRILKSREADLERRINGLRDQLQKLGGAPGGRDRAPGGGGGLGGGKGGGGQQAPGPRPDPNGGNNPRQQIERRLAEFENQLADTRSKLETLGSKGNAADATAKGVVGTLDSGSVKVWTHDITAQPGATYRYRVRVVINNPLFGRNLQQGQNDLSSKPTIVGAWSSWSEPTFVDRDSYFFITSAEETGAITSRPRATAELYQFYYGYYRQASLGVEPGDPLFGKANLPETLKFADMEKLKVAGNEGTPLSTPSPAPAPQPGPGKGPGRMVAPGGDRDAVPGGGNPVNTAPQGAEAGFLTLPAPKNLALSVDAIFLDVLPLPSGSGNARLQAVLRDQTGTVEYRVPERERGGSIYKRVEQSAKAGDKQGVIEAPAPTNEPRRVLPPPGQQPAAPKAPPKRDGGGGG